MPTQELIQKAKEIVLKEYPDAFCYTCEVKNTVGTYSRNEYIIQRIINKLDPDGDDREDLSPYAFSEEDAWIYAADRIAHFHE